VHLCVCYTSIFVCCVRAFCVYLYVHFVRICLCERAVYLNICVLCICILCVSVHLSGVIPRNLCVVYVYFVRICAFVSFCAIMCCVGVHFCECNTSTFDIIYVLQHTTTHCNTLQHTATHCNTLPRHLTSYIYCNTLQHTATHCNTLQHATSTFDIIYKLQHTATHCNTLQHTATRYLDI